MSDTLLRNNYAQLMFYVRERYWHHGEQLCATVAATHDDWLFRVWRGLCLDQQGLTTEAMKEYRTAEAKRQTTIPALMGQLLTYKRLKDNENAVKVEVKLQNAEAAATETAAADALSQAAALAWAAGEEHLARETISRIPESQLEVHADEYTNAATVKAWLNISSGRGALLEKCGAYFQRVLEIMTPLGGGSSNNALDINAALGRVAYLQRKYQFPQAQELLNRLVVAYPNFTPVLVVKARLLMRAEDWDQAIDTTRRILAKDKSNVEALSLQALHALAKDARPAAAVQYLGALWTAMQEKEPRNAALMFQYAQAFSRLAGGTGGTNAGSSGVSLQLLSITGKFSSAACAIEPRNGAFLTEEGCQSFYRGDHKAAIATFHKAAELTDSLAPLLGAAACSIKLGKLEEAAKQCALCGELQSDATGGVAELQLLNAKLAWRLRHDQPRALALLDQAAEAVRKDIENTTGANGMDLYVRVNVPLMLDIAREYSQHSRSEPPDPTFRHADPVGEKVRVHLELLLRHVPGCMEARVLLARVRYISGQVAEAKKELQACLFGCEQPLPEGFLLSAQICLYTGDLRLASQALEQALTLDFEVKDQPLYNVLHGVVLASQGGSAAQSQKALDAFQLAMSIVKNPDRVTQKGRAIEPLNVPDHITLYLQLAQVHLRLHDADEARKLLAECATQFRGTQQAGRIAIAQSMLAARTDIDKSIELLRQVPATSDFYVSAQTQMAKMYLVHKQDPIRYIRCFEDMVKERATPQGYVELGDAYMAIQEPEKAIAAFEKAKAMDPRNGELAVRVGRALVSTHDYKRSIRYYEDALAADDALFAVRADLAMLYWHLGDANMAVQALKEAPVYRGGDGGVMSPTPGEDVVTAVERVNCALLIYKISKASGNGAAAIEALLQARTAQIHVLEAKLGKESRETMLQQKTVMATILTELGRHYTEVAVSSGGGEEQPQQHGSSNNNNNTQSSGGVDMTRAKEFLNEALTFDDAFEPAMIALAQLYLDEDAVTATAAAGGGVSNNTAASSGGGGKNNATTGSSKKGNSNKSPSPTTSPGFVPPSAAAEQCERWCNAVRRINPNCEEAVVILTTLMTRQGDNRAEEARHLFQQLLDDNPANYEALVEYIRLLRNAGDLDGVDEAVERAAAKAPVNQRPDPGLSFARGMACRFTNTSADALRALNLARLPSDNPWSRRALEAMIHTYLVPTTVDMWADTWAMEKKSDNLRCAEQLLLQLPLDNGRQVLQGFCLVATKRRPDLDKAVQLFLGVIKATQPQSEAERAAQAEEERVRRAEEEKAMQAAVANDEVDEDDLLLAAMEKAPVPGAAADTPAVVGTLAEALRCRVVHPPAFLGLAIALYLSSQATAARNILRRLLDISTSQQRQLQQQYPDEIERARLFTAFLCVHEGDLAEATRHLQDAIARNKSCSSAWDALGTLYERQQNHAEASRCFSEAWRLVRAGDPAVGYKLAFCHLKTGDPVRAIDVSRTVLSHHAGYPRIEEDVMDVAFSMLRP